MTGNNVLSAARGYVIFKKPVGADSEERGEYNVPRLVREELGCEYASACHRLDKAVGGAILVCIDKDAAPYLSRQVSEGRIKKEYLCVCESTFSENERRGEMHDLLFFDRSKQKSFIAKKKRKGVKEASLSYEVLATCTDADGRQLSLLKVLLHTGRTHQIRVQLASRKHPLCGDGKYGSKDNRCSTALWSYSISIDGESTVCPPPRVYPFDLFDTQI